MTESRKQIEKALGPVWREIEENWAYGVCPSLADYAKAIAKKAIVREVKISHHKDTRFGPWTKIVGYGRDADDLDFMYTLRGHWGEEGVGVSIMLPTE